MARYCGLLDDLTGDWIVSVYFSFTVESFLLYVEPPCDEYLPADRLSELVD